MRIGTVFALHVLVVRPMHSPLIGPGIRVAVQHVEQRRPGDAAEFRDLQMARHGNRPEMSESAIFAYC